MKTRFFFTIGGGRFANQLLNQMHLIALKEELGRDVCVINFSFYPYHCYFNSQPTNLDACAELPKPYSKITHLLAKNVLLDNVGSVKRIAKSILLPLHLLSTIDPSSSSVIVGNIPRVLTKLPGQHVDKLDLDDTSTINTLLKKRAVVLAGWPIRCWDFLAKHRSRVIDTLKLAEPIGDRAESYIEEIRKSHDKIVGVVIRHGDYRQWEKGRYFFPLEQYLNWIHQFEERMKDLSIAFILTSNEYHKIDIDRPNIYWSPGTVGGKGTYIDSFAVLSRCDIIMTPPSTFGCVPAFFANGKILPLFNGVDILKEPLLDENLIAVKSHPSWSNSIN